MRRSVQRMPGSFLFVPSSMSAVPFLETSKEIRRGQDSISESIDRAIRQNQMVLQDQAAFQAKEQELRDRYKAKLDALSAINSKIYDRKARADKLENFIETLSKMRPQTEFTPEYLGALVKKVTVFSKTDISVEFVDGKEIKVAL